MIDREREREREREQEKATEMLKTERIKKERREDNQSIPDDGGSLRNEAHVLCQVLS